jgi:hypothetical protein
MDILKIFTGITAAAMEVQKAMADKELTIKEMCDIVDATLRATTGVGLDGVGFKIEKVDGKTKVEFFFSEK